LGSGGDDVDGMRGAWYEIVSNGDVRFATSVVSLTLAHGYIHWLAGSSKELPRHLGSRRRKCAFAPTAMAATARKAVDSMVKLSGDVDGRVWRLLVVVGRTWK
jgi:hypothetical protein